jgi:sarcosine oxidase subunit delta
VLLIECPNCGKRNVSEFRFGGEYNPRPKEPVEAADSSWTDYLFMRENKLGIQVEWWHHRAGCGLWFLAKRHTKTNEIEGTYLWQPSSEPDDHDG